MNKALAQEVLQDIKTTSLRRLEHATVFLQPLSAAYTPVPFSEEHFSEIHLQHANRLLLFVDGGNTEILKTPDYSLQFLRFAAVGFREQQRIFQRIKEGYLLIRTQTIEGKHFFVTQCYGDLAESEELAFAYDDPLLQGKNEIAQIGNIFRALHEIYFAKSVLQEDTVLVFDRALLPENQYEEYAFASLYTLAKEKNCIVTGLNKTTSLLCNTGESVVSVLSHFQRKGTWIYYPVFSSSDAKHKAAISFVKLHPQSSHIFRFEIHKEQNIKEIASWLASLSCDSVFLGYPYGLIVADQLARVSNREKETLRLLFFSFAGERFATTALNAHEILDRIQR